MRIFCFKCQCQNSVLIVVPMRTSIQQTDHQSSIIFITSFISLSFFWKQPQKRFRAFQSQKSQRIVKLVLQKPDTHAFHINELFEYTLYKQGCQ